MTDDRVDVSGWAPIGEEQLGTKPKQWLWDPESGSAVLWKAVTFGLLDGAEFLKGDDWAEIIATKLAGRLGLPAANVRLAARDGHPGVISDDFTSGQTLIHGNVWLSATNPTYEDLDSRIHPHYTPLRVLHSLVDARPPLAAEAANSPGELRNAAEWFVGYLVLDGLVGNTDRHHQNWGILIDFEEPDGDFTLAPTFDHAASLGALLPDEHRAAILHGADGRSVNRWADRAKSQFADRPHPRDVAVQAVSLLPNAPRQLWWERLRALAEAPDLDDVIRADRMSVHSITFAQRLVRHNAERMLSHPLGTVGV